MNKTIEFNINMNDIKKITPVSLPKNDIEYVKAYDIYLETLDKIKNENNGSVNNCFDAAPLKAIILFNIIVDDETKKFKTKLSISHIRTEINEEFINYIKKENGDLLPDWLVTLTTDWNKEYLNTLLNLNN